ncbi:hypothetical protein N431DRAFT_442961 [Stipitochalara longipes BDJ]|nr:hypothetical protein N431DRAFT_442961 [Stipitochalara longipes BDJ]
MSFFLGNDEVLSDPEYESAKSHPSTPLESPPLDLNGNPMRSTGREKTKKKLRRGTGIPASFLRFPRGRIDEDAEKIEDDVNQLLNLGETIKGEVEVRAHTLISTANKRRDLLPQELKRDTHLEQDLSLPKLATSTSDASSYPHHNSPTQVEKDAPSPSMALAFRPKQAPNKPNQETQLQSLQQSLTQIRTHLAALESAISANISSQLIILTGSSDPSVADPLSLPNFQVKKKQRETVGAILGTVKVACAVERGLEALIGVLELAEKGVEEESGGKGLMDACLESPEEVALEMQRAILGMRRVLKSKAVPK